MYIPNGFSIELVSHHFIIDMQLVSSPRTSQSSQFCKASPTTQEQLEKPSNSSNPSQLDENNLPSLDLDANFFLTSTRGHKSCRESPSSLSPASTPHQRPHTHTYASHFLLPLPSPPFSRPPYFLCIHEISINEKLSRKFCH